VVRSPAVEATSLLFRVHCRRLDDRRPARDLVFYQPGEGLLTAPGRVGNLAAEGEQALLCVFVIDRLVERVAELVEDRLRRPLGREVGTSGSAGLRLELPIA
jgi:hypothetical protein